jgi:hypothetical protein
VTKPARPPDELRVRRIRRERRDIALAHAEGNLDDAEYLAAVARLREQERAAPTPPPRVEPREVVRRLRDFTALWASRSDTQRAEMIRSVYSRVEVEGPKFVAAHLTPDARDLGLTVALPEQFVMASPAGFEPATRCLEGSRSSPLSYGDERAEYTDATIATPEARAGLELRPRNLSANERPIRPSISGVHGREVAGSATRWPMRPT